MANPLLKELGKLGPRYSFSANFLEIPNNRCRCPFKSSQGLKLCWTDHAGYGAERIEHNCNPNKELADFPQPPATALPALKAGQSLKFGRISVTLAEFSEFSM
jgi:hypothetical protein